MATQRHRAPSRAPIRWCGTSSYAVRTKAELNSARWDFIVRLADDLVVILREATERGYSPRPRA